MENTSKISTVSVWTLTEVESFDDGKTLCVETNNFHFSSLLHYLLRIAVTSLGEHNKEYIKRFVCDFIDECEA